MKRHRHRLRPGTFDLEGQPNVVRIISGEARKKRSPLQRRNCRHEANLDDNEPEITATFWKKLWPPARSTFTPHRANEKEPPGTLLTVLCKPQDTNTLNVADLCEQRHLARAHLPRASRTLPREVVSVATNYGDVRIKISR